MARHYESWEEGKRLKITTINLYPYQVKMIDKISNLEKMPPLLRKFAERWKEKC